MFISSNNCLLVRNSFVLLSSNEQFDFFPMKKHSIENDAASNMLRSGVQVKKLAQTHF